MRNISKVIIDIDSNVWLKINDKIIAKISQKSDGQLKSKTIALSYMWDYNTLYENMTIRFIKKHIPHMTLKSLHDCIKNNIIINDLNPYYGGIIRRGKIV